jgi:predicted acyl esterase
LDILRAGYGNGTVKPVLPEPKSIVKLTLDRMLTSNTFLAGHRIRVQISGAFFPHFSRNLQTGKSEITSSATRIAHVRIYHDAKHPSRIVLPIIPR